jgi:hypothetical protein
VKGREDTLVIVREEFGQEQSYSTLIEAEKITTSTGPSSEQLQ